MTSTFVPTHPLCHPRRRRGERGFNLVEVMVALAVVAVGFTSLLGTVTVALNHAQQTNANLTSYIVARSFADHVEASFGIPWTAVATTPLTARRIETLSPGGKLSEPPLFKPVEGNGQARVLNYSVPPGIGGNVNDFLRSLDFPRKNPNSNSGGWGQYKDAIEVYLMNLTALPSNSNLPPGLELPAAMDELEYFHTSLGSLPINNPREFYFLWRAAKNGDDGGVGPADSDAKGPLAYLASDWTNPADDMLRWGPYNVMTDLVQLPAATGSGNSFRTSFEMYKLTVWVFPQDFPRRAGNATYYSTDPNARENRKKEALGVYEFTVKLGREHYPESFRNLNGGLTL